MTPHEYRAKRESLGYTQAQLAHLLGVTVTTISRRETGARGLSKVSYEAELAINTLPPKG